MQLVIFCLHLSAIKFSVYEGWTQDGHNWSTKRCNSLLHQVRLVENLIIPFWFRCYKRTETLGGVGTREIGRVAKIIVVPGKAIQTPPNQSSATVSSSIADLTVSKRRRGRPPKQDTCNISNLLSSEDEDFCDGCSAYFSEYQCPNWIRCISCFHWYFGACNNNSSDPY